MRTVVADTSALVSLAIPHADPSYDTDEDPDPLQFLLTSCTVFVPVQVLDELEEIASYDDLDATAATNVLAAAAHYVIEDPTARSDTLDELPEYGLDTGETAGIALANARGVDGFLTDEFTTANFTLIHAQVAGSKIVTTPRLLRDVAYNDHVTTEDALECLDVIARNRWGESVYVRNVRRALEESSD